ncbi:hypothetical protein GCM10009431_16770 [Gaetbulibacter jejuensis]|uniref:Transposase n=1 Tax=Gaetbulibacter jejuensis TaxID=584607 RepID=A0ABP3UVW4_9FLAO
MVAVKNHFKKYGFCKGFIFNFLNEKKFVRSSSKCELEEAYELSFLVNSVIKPLKMNP